VNGGMFEVYTKRQMLLQ